ncbi:MAG TPA: flagellar hook protein FlgE [Firmicutes bacterium]|nr:flagellar hook protein FlgE [Bacillota bacterium]
MIRALFAGVSGSRAHQTRMDVIGNNVANVNTIAFKSGRVTFEDLMYQTLRGAAAPTADGRGGINGAQVGLGTRVRSIDTLIGQGNLEYTDIPTDLAIDGAGYFIVSDGTRNFYTRDGSLRFDANGVLTHASTGLKLQGWMSLRSDGTVDTTTKLEDIRIPLGAKMSARATSQVKLGGNLNSNASAGDKVEVQIEVFDSLGNAHQLTMTFEKTDDPATLDKTEWTWEVTTAEPGVTIGSGTGSISFDQYGQCTGGQTATITLAPGGGAAQASIELNFSALTQYAADFSVRPTFWDGYSAGELEDFTISNDGQIVGIYSNGQHELLGQLALANFANAGGLTAAGSNLYSVSPNSGAALISRPTAGGCGKVACGALEMSNVDLAREFTDMIITQRGFQANSRIITTADEMLQELINLKR